MKIVIFEAKPRDRKFFDKSLKSHSLRYVEEPLTSANAKKYAGADIACTFIFSKVDAKVLSLMPKLKFLVTRSTGFDHINLKACKRKKIVVSNVPAYGDNTVAEHTFALILNLSRNVHKSYVRAQSNNFEINDLTGFDLKDKWLGVIGAGNIGQNVIKIAKGFGMHVIAFDVHKNQFLADLLHFDYADSVEEVLKKSDIISLHAPANKHTFHMINAKTLRLVKKGALLINTSRGELVDTDALYEALKSGRLGGAGLDVVEGEQLVQDDDKALLVSHNDDALKQLLENKEILHMDNVVYTPHNAFNSKEALLRILEITAENISGFVSGKVINVLD